MAQYGEVFHGLPTQGTEHDEALHHLPRWIPSLGGQHPVARRIHPTAAHQLDQQGDSSIRGCALLQTRGQLDTEHPRDFLPTHPLATSRVTIVPEGLPSRKMRRMPSP